jgi:hypothetical protein
MGSLQSNFAGIETRQYVFHWRGKMKTDLFSDVWEGHSLRFVEYDGQWGAVAADVCKALDIDNHRDAVQGVQNSLREAGLDEKGVVSNYTLPTNGGKQRLLCVNEAGLNLLIMRSRKKEAVSTKFGFPKMVKKGSMDEAMLHDRQSALDDTVQLMALNERLGLGLSVSKTIYRKYSCEEAVK